MKKSILLVAMLTIAAGVTGCGSSENTYLSNNSSVDHQGTANSAEVDSITESGENTAIGSDTEAPSNTDPSSDSTGSGDGEIDIDLTKLSSSMVYAQVYDMVYNGDNYIGKKVKAKGPFSYYQEPDGREFFAVIISDATACCSQGIEFVLDGDYSYPDDYPAIGTDITVVGKFNYYKENYYTYCQLTDATMEADTSLSWE